MSKKMRRRDFLRAGAAAGVAAASAKTLSAGAPADLVVLDSEGRVRRTMLAGRWLDG